MQIQAIVTITGGTIGKCLVIAGGEKREARRRERRREEKRGTLVFQTNAPSCTAWQVLIQTWKSIFVYLHNSDGRGKLSPQISA